MLLPDPTELMKELIEEIGATRGPCERVLAQWSGAAAEEAAGAIQAGEIRDESVRIVDELRRSWGPTADPSWVDDLVPGRGSDKGHGDDDFMFALFQKSGFWGYVRLRGSDGIPGGVAHMRLIVGVVRAEPENLKRF